MSQVTIGELVEDLIPHTEKGNKVMPVAIVPRRMIEAIINKCEEDKNSCCDVTGTKEAEDDAIVFSYASEIIDFAKGMLKEFEEGE